MISRYVFLFQRKDRFFLYNSRTNSFYELPPDSHEVLRNLRDTGSTDGLPEDFASLMREKRIIVSEGEDDAYADYLRLSYLKSACDSSCLRLTILPTISCNLRCHYCFEQAKAAGFMNDETIDKLTHFIKNNSSANRYSITWYGGEPLLCVGVMEKILGKLETEEDYKRTGHSLVTNGTLMTKRARDLFRRFPLDSVQITLDGLRSSHDSKRFFENGGGTFDIILKNVGDFLDACPDTAVSFRINVDNANKSEYPELHRMLHDRFRGCSVSVYPGILRANRGCEDETFLSSAEHLSFSRMLWSNRIADMYPSPCSKGCCATYLSSHVIGPAGELYLCWEHVGHPEKIVGYIDGSPGHQTDIYARFKLHGHCFDDPACMACGLLPVCSGGCADKRIQNINGEGGHNLCPVYNEKDGKGLEDALYEYFTLQSPGRDVTI